MDQEFKDPQIFFLQPSEANNEFKSLQTFHIYNTVITKQASNFL